MQLMNEEPGNARSSSADKVGLLGQGLDLLDEGFGIFDPTLTLVECNRRFGELLGCPPELCRPGMPIIDLYRFHAARGEYGSGDREALAAARLEQARTLAEQRFERL